MKSEMPVAKNGMGLLKIVSGGIINSDELLPFLNEIKTKTNDKLRFKGLFKKAPKPFSFRLCYPEFSIRMV
ncbi:hypothetical protein [Rouxiella badensis]|jgi:hypothetical protein|uniref:hypothetical protein n=1 Tax=Rouxiella badensis TaxID=1646377 RepID=UPI0022AB0BFF|nr:hypothetical protein [Rouxiella badensis]WAT07938.1 hypothetical protein O1V65_16940 [Rouxiella badensis]